MSERYVESKVRTKRLWCSKCLKKINRGDDVIFKLKHGKMEEVFCEKCKSDYEVEAYHDCIHPFSEEAFHN